MQDAPGLTVRVEHVLRDTQTIRALETSEIASLSSIISFPSKNGAVWLEDAESFETIVFVSVERTELCNGGVEVDVVSDMFERRAD